MNEAIERRLRAVAEELATAISDVAGTTVTSTPGGTANQGGWRVTMTATGDPAGRLVVLLEGAGTTHLATHVLREAAASSDEGTGETAGLLREVLSRAAAAMATRGSEERLALVVDGVERAAAHDGYAPDAVALEFSLEGFDSSIPVQLAWTHAPEVNRASGRGVAAGSRLDVILDIELPVVVRFGYTQMPIRALSQLGPGSVIELGRSPDDPVEVLVSNRVVARGEVVIVGGNYGVRILDVTSQSERARSMEG